jgi:polyphosphate glucokinase
MATRSKAEKRAAGRKREGKVGPKAQGVADVVPTDVKHADLDTREGVTVTSEAAPKQAGEDAVMPEPTPTLTLDSQPAHADDVHDAVVADLAESAQRQDDHPKPPFTLAIDIGGTGIKCLLLDADGKPSGKRQRQETPRPATPDAVLQVIKGLIPDTAFDRVSVGFPGVVVGGVIHSAPNLDPSFAGFDLQSALSHLTEKPVRVLNDAGLQGLGAIAGSGTEVVITLGTGMGFAIYVEGRYVPNVELAHHPLSKRRTYEENVGNRARKKFGNRKWSKRVKAALLQIQKTFNPQRIYVGGGNAAKLSAKLPDGVVIIDNIAGLLGGIALWR